MSELIDWVRAVMLDGEFQVFASSDQGCLVFEDETVMGFVFAYDSVESLASSWCIDFDRAVAKCQFHLRSADRKAWNVYGIFLAGACASKQQLASLHQIEEDLVGARKIARGGIRGREDVEAALLSILPLQKFPGLEPIDFRAELSVRLGSLQSRAVEAFFSEAPEQVVVQVLEERE